MFSVKRTLIKRLLICLLGLAGVSWGSMEIADRVGAMYFSVGQEVVTTVGKMGQQLSKRNYAGIESFYAMNFQGTRLGLNLRKLALEKDGMNHYRMEPDGAASDRAAALAEWRQYLDSFESIEAAELHLFRLESWWSRDSVVAKVRFELIGTPKGAKRPGIDRGYLRMTLAGQSGQLLIKAASLLNADRVISDTPQFVEVGKAAGIDFMNRYYPPFTQEKLKFAMIVHGPAGITTVDYDHDGFYDLFIPDGIESRLFRNNSDGTFTDVTRQAGLTGIDGVNVGVFADYDNDGSKDFFVCRTFQPNQLFHNNGDGTFTDVTRKAGIGADLCATAASWGDYDGDGLLDLYVGRYLDPREKLPTTMYSRNGLPNQLYHNNGDGTFTNVTEKAGVADPGLTLATAFGDYDNDGLLDLYVVNDFGRKTLYHNNGNGTFSDVTVRSGTIDYGAGMSAAWGDYDNDGWLDIYVANIRTEENWLAEWPTVGRYMVNSVKHGVWRTDVPLYMQIFLQSRGDVVGAFKQMASGNTLMRNRGTGTFEDVTWKADANPIGWFWGSSFADFDNDGWLDIYSANGWVYGDKGDDIELQTFNDMMTRQQEYKQGMFFDPAHFGTSSWHGWERKRHLLNNGDGSFTEIGRAADSDLLTNGRGIAIADYWNRGVLDIAMAASGARHTLLRNEVGSRRHWLAVELVGTKSNRDAVGARVYITVAGKQQMREVVLGDGYASQNSLRQYFGLGSNTSIDEMRVKWPTSGIVQIFRNLAADRIIEVTEGNDVLVAKRYAAKSPPAIEPANKR